MRKVEFNVPSEAMVGFAQELADRDLSNTITGVTEDDEIIIEVEYEKSETADVDSLEAVLENLRDEDED
jgi:hypothetical protein